MVFIYSAQMITNLGDYLLQITKERMLLFTTKKRIFANARGNVVDLVTLHIWEV